MPDNRTTSLTTATLPLAPTDKLVLSKTSSTNSTSVAQFLDPVPLTKAYNPASLVSPPTTGLKLYSERIGRSRPAWVGPAGINVSTQSFLGGNKIGWWTASGNSNTAYNSGTPGIWLMNFGHTLNGGTMAAATVNPASPFLSMRRMTFTTSTTANTVCGTRHGLTQFSRMYGYEYIVRFGISTLTPNGRVFVGMNYLTSGIAAGTEPSTIPGAIGIYKDSSNQTGNFWLVCGGLTTDLGSNFPLGNPSNDMYEFSLFCAPNTEQINWAVTRLNTGHYAEGVFTTLTVADMLYSPIVHATNGSDAAVMAIDLVSQYIETDF